MAAVYPEWSVSWVALTINTCGGQRCGETVYRKKLNLDILGGSLENNLNCMMRWFMLGREMGQSTRGGERKGNAIFKVNKKQKINNFWSCWNISKKNRRKRNQKGMWELRGYRGQTGSPGNGSTAVAGKAHIQTTLQVIFPMAEVMKCH